MKVRPFTVKLASVRMIPFWLGKATVACKTTGRPAKLGLTSIVIGRVTYGKVVRIGAGHDLDVVIVARIGVPVGSRERRADLLVLAARPDHQDDGAGLRDGGRCECPSRDTRQD